MSNDVERMFASLAEDAGRARLAPAADVRRRADRRLAVQSVAGVAAVAVLVTGVTVGARTVLADPDRSPVVPVESVAPGPSAPAPGPSAITPPAKTSPSSPSSRPPSSRPPSSAPAPSIPDSIPARAFVQKADWDGDVVDGPTRTAHEIPQLCGTKLPSDDLIGVRATAVLSFRAPGVPDEYTPNGTVHDTVTVYRGAGARDFLRDLRDAVRTCPVDTVEGREYRYRSRGPVGQGDESLLIEESTAGYGDDGEPSGTTRYAYLAAVRTGDTVAFVEVDGWESASAERDDAVTFARAAGRRAGDWRG
jgi:hypothetical protein